MSEGSSHHIPILLLPIVDRLTEVLPDLVKKNGAGVVVDCTLGGGGHASALAKKIADIGLDSQVKVIGNDRDAVAIEAFRQNLGVTVRHGNFSTLAQFLENQSVYGILADLGFSSDQIDDPERGLSFQREGPIDMRLDRSQGKTAFEILRELSEKQLADLIFQHGEERLSRKISSAIKTSLRAKELVNSTTALARLIEYSVPSSYRHGRIHPATRTFQALRIAVNDELGELNALLNDVILNVKTGGRIAILSFHSLEDRMVKQAFKGNGFRSLTKKPIEASELEIRENPRSRSAKLRVAERTEA